MNALPNPLDDPQFYQGVPLRRLIAFVIDLVIVAVLMVLVMVLGAVLGLFTAGLATLIGFVLFFFTGFLYRYMLISQRSATLGMQAVGIELRDRAGQRLDAPTTLVHTAGFYVSMMFPLLMIVGWAVMIATPHRRLMHDLLPGTVAINKPL